MSPRRYRMDRRAETAEDTRQRIVRATYELHAERGLAATTPRDVATRAGVATGTVYHHFPTYSDMIDACGAYTDAVTRPPTTKLLSASKGEPSDRIRTLVEAWFDYYGRFSSYDRIRAERAQFPQIETAMRTDEANRRKLVALTMKPGKPARAAAALAFALLDFTVYEALVGEGLSHREAIDCVADLLAGVLLGKGSASR